MKVRRPIIALALGLATFVLLFAPELIVRYQPQTARLTYSLTKDITQGLGITFFILYLWTSGALFQEHKRLSIGLLLAALIPISVATVLAISDVYHAVNAPRPDQQGMMRDNSSSPAGWSNTSFKPSPLRGLVQVLYIFTCPRPQSGPA